MPNLIPTRELIEAQRTYLIRKGGSWYRPNSQGYTNNAWEAGRYTLEEAIDLTHPNGKNGPRDGLTYVNESDLPATALRNEDRQPDGDLRYDTAWPEEARAEVKRLAAVGDRYKAALEARDDLLCLADCLLMEVLGGFPLDNPSQEFCLAIRKVTGEDHALRKQRAAAALAAFRQALATGAEHAD